jgi:predicted AAA+ superfamily ATPase
VARAYVPRLIDALLRDLVTELPAVMLVGPRSTGKTTTAARHAKTIVRLDREAEAVAFRADPDAALRGMEEPVLLDEWQVVPGVLAAVKRAVDADARPGRYLITGSVRADLESDTWPGTGRIVRLPLSGLTVRELRDPVADPPLFDRLVRDGIATLRVPKSPHDLRDYIDLALQGGFPEPALHLAKTMRGRWFDSYIEQTLTRDAEQLAAGRDPERLRRYFEALALNTAGVVDVKTLHDAARINRKTADAYDALLQNLRISEALPAWTTNRLKRLVRLPKRYLVDCGLVASSLRLDAEGVLRDGDLLGRLLDTFVAAQLRPEIPVCAKPPRLYHLRQEQGRHEIDLIAELGGDRVIAIEVKADAAPGSDTAKHLRWLRDELGKRFVLGLVLHTGPRVFELDERITAAPIATLWS